MSPDEAEQLLRKTCEQLGEHFDAVHIFVSSHIGGSSEDLVLDEGSGSYLARYGHVRSWMFHQEEHMKNPYIATELEDEDDAPEDPTDPDDQ